MIKAGRRVFTMKIQVQMVLKRNQTKQKVENSGEAVTMELKGKS
jgi:hypothetical protein